MRTLIAITLVSWIACSAEIRACCGSSYTRDDEGIYAFLTNSPVPREEGVFRNDWMLAGIEEFTAICATGVDKSSPKSDSGVDMHNQFYADMWTTPPGDGQSIVVDGCCNSYFLPPSVIRTPIVSASIPPFDSAWLTDAVWPRTKIFLVGAKVKADAGRYAMNDECL